MPPPDDKPIDLDDTDDRPRRRRRPEPDDEGDPEPESPRQKRIRIQRNFAQLKWLFAGAGGLLAFGAFNANSIQAGPIAGLACFAAILARISQAEEHRRD